MDNADASGEGSPQKKKKMAAPPASFADKAGTVAFFVLVLCANLAAWATCHCLQLAYTSGLLRLLTSRFKGSSNAAKTVVVDDDTYARQVKEGLAIVATRHFWWLALLLARPWVRHRSTAATSPGQWDALRRDLADSCRRGEAAASEGSTTAAAAATATATATAAPHPILLMSNHVSFLDTMVTTAATPADVLWHTRLYMAANLLKVS
jgi:hypothetical protein